MGLRKKYWDWVGRRHIKKYRHKNIGPFNAFNKKWFEKRMLFLVWLCNHWLLKYWWRYTLRIHKDVGWNEKICELLPHCYTTYTIDKKGQLLFKTDFRTHWKFSKRIYFAYRPVWWLMHYWDSLLSYLINFIKSVFPKNISIQLSYYFLKLDFGFFNLSYYPSSTESGSCDGEVARNISPSYESFSSIISNTGTIGTTEGNTNAIYLVSGGSIDGYVQNKRLIHTFNTSNLKGYANISAAVLNIHTGSKTNQFSEDPDIHVVKASPSSYSTLTASDYNNVTRSTSFSSKLWSSLTNYTYHSFTLNAAGRSSINQNKATGFAYITSWDQSGTNPPTTSSDLLQLVVYSSELPEDPRLDITYTLQNQPVYEDNGGIFAEGDYSVTCDYPATVNLNDICIVQLGDADNDSFTEPTGDGWNKIDEETANSNWSTTWMWKRCDGTEGGTTQTFTTLLGAGAGVYGVISRYSGCKTDGNPYEANTKTTVSQSTTSTVSSITTLGPARLVLSLINVEDNMTISTPTDYTEVYYLSSTFGGDAALKIVYQEVPISGTMITERTSSLGGNEYQNTFTFALIPAVVGWTGKFNKLTNPSKVNGITVAGITKVNKIT